MKTNEKTLNPLTVVKPTPAQYKTRPASTRTKATLRKRLREEARMLTAIGRALLIIGFIVEITLCSHCGDVYNLVFHYLKDVSGSVNTAPCTAAAIAVCVIGLMAAIFCILLAMALFGSAESIRQQTKKLK